MEAVISRPSGLNTPLAILAEYPVLLDTSLYVEVSQTRIVLSRPAVASREPSCRNARPVTGA
jgi:hypothetical protein